MFRTFETTRKLMEENNVDGIIQKLFSYGNQNYQNFQYETKFYKPIQGTEVDSSVSSIIAKIPVDIV
jgi:hypothetical protein